MAEEINITSWTDYVAFIEKLQAMRQGLKKKAYLSPLLFRGQPDSKWELDTTLERAGGCDLKMIFYFEIVSRLKCKIESMTETNWPLMSKAEYVEELQRPEVPFARFPGYEYYAYLRHHGFPSPLLDWSRSPFVAALFAMAPTPKEDVDFASIFVFLESKSGGKFGESGEPAIYSLGPNVKTTKRHYLQQSEYTVCISGEREEKQYSSHKEVFKRQNPEQDRVWKLNIPKDQRLTFLHHLYQMNITPYSLFQTEDKLT